MRHKTIAIAGTFDRLHSGHRFFISEAFKMGEKVVIGLTSDKFVKKKVKTVKTKNVEEFSIREKDLKAFLEQKGWLARSKIIAIDDVYGSAANDNEIEALVVTPESLEGGRRVNGRRHERGLKLLKLLKIPIKKAQDSRKISSTRVRMGEIDRLGKVYGKLSIWGKRIPDDLRVSLKKPIGKLIKGSPNNLFEIADQIQYIITAISPVLISTIGDEVTKMCNKIGIKPNLSVFDFKVKRIKIYNSLEDLAFQKQSGPNDAVYSNLIRVKNPPGHITKSLVKTIKKSLFSIHRDGKQRLIKIIGEDDLAALPVILLSPLNSIVLYGQPDEGVVVVEVTEEVKERLLSIISENRG